MRKTNTDNKQSNNSQISLQAAGIEDNMHTFELSEGFSIGSPEVYEPLIQALKNQYPGEQFELSQDGRIVTARIVNKQSVVN
jgi:hypothetical protein